MSEPGIIGLGTPGKLRSARIMPCSFVAMAVGLRFMPVDDIRIGTKLRFKASAAAAPCL